MSTSGPPLISCLCVTEDRTPFIPWLLWNFEKQSWPRRELVIVDSSRQPACVGSRQDVRIVAAPPKTNVPTKRNMAMEAARGGIITWFDDDDWQHPNKLAWLAEAMGKDAPYAGTVESFFVRLEDGLVLPYKSPRSQIIFNSAAFRRDIAGAVRFPQHMAKASDSLWLQQLRLACRAEPAVVRRRAIFFWLSHNANLSNPASKRTGRHSLQFLRDIIADGWGDTDEQLAKLRQRLRPAAASESAPAGVRVSAINGRSPAPKATACLLSWKRPYNMQPIVDSLSQHPFIDEIIVWNNNPDVRLDLKGSRVRVINSGRNDICYGRFLCAKQARNDVIYTQDDDVIVNNVPSLFRRYVEDRSRLVHALSNQHYRRRERYVYADGHNALLGWGAFFKKEWIRLLDDYVSRYGADEIFRRGADIVFTLLLGQRHSTHAAQLRTLPGSSKPGVAMCHDSDHSRKNALAVRCGLAALRERRAVRYPVAWNVVITSFNYGRFLRDAVESVLNSDADYVVTIVDDSSSDNTEQIGRQYAQTYDHVSYIRVEENGGVSRARNLGVASVDSLFVVLLDADDRIGRDYLYEAEKVLRSGADVANPDAIVFGQTSARWPVPELVTAEDLRQRNCVHCCAAFRRSYWAQVGGVCEEMTNWMDYEFWIRMAKAGARIRRVGGDHFYYRKHGRSKSTDSAAQAAQLTRLIQQRHWPCSSGKAAPAIFCGPEGVGRG